MLKKKIVIIDSGSGNLYSVSKAFKYVCNYDYEILISNNFDDINNSDYIVLPGVGAFKNCMSHLSINKLLPVLNKNVIELKKPFLGICIGMQIIASEGQENGLSYGLGWIKGCAVPLNSIGLPVPHMGWNNIKTSNHEVLKGCEGYMYFAHSYHFLPDTVSKNKGIILAETFYGRNFVSAIGRDNIIGVQFHPEKSYPLGLDFLANFSKWQP